jgi:hypothetical protein
MSDTFSGCERVYVTSGVHLRMVADDRFGSHVDSCLRRHLQDQRARGPGIRLFSAYPHATYPEILIITAEDLNSTTILFRSEY